MSYAQQERDDLQEINVDKTSRSNQMTCYNCDSELIWGGDQDIEEEFDHEDVMQCNKFIMSKMWTFVVVYTPKSFFTKFRKDGMYK